MSSISIEEFKKIKQKKHKYNAKSTCVDGILFPSKGHAQYYVHLKFQKRAGVIKNIFREIPLRYQIGIDAPWHKLTFDFMVQNLDNTMTFIEFKGMITKDFIHRLEAVQCFYKDISIKIAYKDKEEKMQHFRIEDCYTVM